MNLLIILILVLGSELLLRQVFGFGRPLLYRSDPHMGYRVAPSQNIQRFGNRIRINQFSMRNDPITPERSPQTLRILMLGDSLVNGMVWTDQDQTLTALVQQKLAASDQIPTAIVAQGEIPQSIEVLNVAAGSWAPRNELAYLREFGTFESQLLILVINTDDFFGAPPRPEVVGQDPAYPDRYPLCAWAEFLEQFWRRLPLPSALKPKRSKLVPLPPEKDVVGINLKAIDDIYTLTQTTNTQFLLILSPLRRELDQQGGSRDYEKKARQRLQHWVNDRQISYLDLLPSFNAHPNPLDLYSDHIHLSLLGNQWVAETIVRELGNRE